VAGIAGQCGPFLALFGAQVDVGQDAQEDVGRLAAEVLRQVLQCPDQVPRSARRPSAGPASPAADRAAPGRSGWAPGRTRSPDCAPAPAAGPGRPGTRTARPRRRHLVARRIQRMLAGQQAQLRQVGRTGL
jgi:hypothetical protein